VSLSLACHACANKVGNERMGKELTFCVSNNNVGNVKKLE
jgi:hypothetical protein